MKKKNAFQDMPEKARKTLANALDNPELWSEPVIRETLARTGSQSFSIHDLQTIIREYLYVLSDRINVK